jgi:hypothetical protein
VVIATNAIASPPRPGPAHPLTAAEKAAGVETVDASIPSHVAARGEFYPERYGANTNPGSTPMSAAIQTAIKVAASIGGGSIVFAASNYQLALTAITIPSRITLRMAEGGRFTVDSRSPQLMPQAYISLVGSRIEIDGCNGLIESNPFGSYAARGSFIGFGASDISDIKIQRCSSRGFMHGIFGSGFEAIVANRVCNVSIEHCRFTSFACDIYYTGLAPHHWRIEATVHDGRRPAPSNNAGAVQILAGVNVSNVDLFTQAANDTGCGQNISILNCRADATLDRVIRLINCRQIEVANNTLDLRIGSFFADQGVFSADAMTFDLCRQLSCHHNTIRGGGENGIDLLSCQDYHCHHNVIRRCNTSGIYVFLSDLWNSSRTSPKLASITSRAILQNKNGDIHDNLVESFDCMHVAAGQNIVIRDNQLKPFKTSTYWAKGHSPDLISLDNTAGGEYFAEAVENWQRDIAFFGNKPLLSDPIEVAFDGAGVFSTLNSLPHAYVNGDRVKLAADPGGDYFVIVTGQSTFRLAGSLSDAFSAHPVGGHFAGLARNRPLQVREQAWPTVVNISVSFYTRTQNILLDDNIGFTSNWHFSSLRPGSRARFA